MAQPSKVGPIFLTLFALPFLGGGLFFIYAQLVSRQNFKTADLAVGIAIASFFVFIGGGLIFASNKGYALLKKQAALQEANPQSPWLWRADWSTQRADSANKKSFIAAWIAAGFANLITLPILFGIAPKYLRDGDPRVIILLLFSSFGVILTICALRATIRHERFGNSYFEMDALPFSPGLHVTGRIQLRFDTQADHGIDLRLSCVRRIVTGSGNNRSTSKITLWQADKNVPMGAIGSGPMGRSIPVDFELPADGLVTDNTNYSDQILWLLHAQADVPGVNYSDDFELPVFRTASSPQAAVNSSTQAAPSNAGFGFATASQTIDGDSGDVPQPARTKVVVSMHDGGTEFYFPAFRTPGRALLLFLVSMAFTGAVYALLHSSAPLFFTAVSVLGDLFVIYGFFHVAFGSMRIFVGNGEIVSRGGVFGIGAPRRTPFLEVASIIPVASLQQGGNSDNSVYAIRMLTKSGKKFTLADEISSRQEARWVVSQIEALAGLKLDTHVEVDLPLGVQGQPVQLRTTYQGGRSQSATASLISFAIFVAMVAGFFVWQGKRFSSRTVRVSRTSNSRAAAPRPNPVVPRVFSSPMGDADVARVSALPTQQQAEELFERAIGHDALALKVLNQQKEGWVGHIHESDRMTQLLQRGQFSKDLRVRLAQVDLSLALQGFHEDQHAVDSLIHRADTDPQYRAWALYYLGMLAGRGVAYDRIHPVLLSYARHDTDASVRQWAVEGLRFLGKDEVLDELYTAFTEDPSMSVRDRAGCNISDCGIFTRKQRMHMVPKLIDLAAQPNLSPQMRNWCFMALREITDENSTADAIAWNRWYADHGADKMAEFERLEWWQVRGDE